MLQTFVDEPLLVFFRLDCVVCGVLKTVLADFGSEMHSIALDALHFQENPGFSIAHHIMVNHQVVDGAGMPMLSATSTPFLFLFLLRRTLVYSVACETFVFGFLLLRKVFLFLLLLSLSPCR